jgi:tight adherence protein B
MKHKIEVEERIKGLTYEKEQKNNIKEKAKTRKRENNKIKKTRKELEQIEEELYDVGIIIPVQSFVVMWIGTAICIPACLIIVGLNKIICMVLVVVIAFGPMLYIVRKKKKRKEKLESQLIDAISVLCNALKAGHSFQSAMSNIATDMEAPIAQEFGRVFRETQRGMSLEESMNRMVERTKSDDLNMLCTAILIQRKVGGNLADVLEKISETIQSRLGLKMEIKTRTSSGRLSGYIVGALPFLLLGAMSLINPDYSSIFFERDIGKIMLAVGAVWEIIGFVVIKKIVTIKY